MSISGFLESALKANLCFFGYRIPGDEPRYGACRVSDLIPGMGRGFVVQPFNHEDDPVTIPSIIVRTEEIEDQQSYWNLDTPEFPEYDTALEYYRRHASCIIDYLKNHDWQKVVYSRVITGDWEHNLDVFFHNLSAAYPVAYIFCFSTPQTGLWIGASPELLGNCDGRIFSTVALAGTMKSHFPGRWSDKNRREQQIVADYIRMKLHDAGFDNIKETGGQKIAGPVKHLITEFSAVVETGDDCTGFGRRFKDCDQIARSLSPTPALSGWPVEEALKLIRIHEAYSRGCYGGFCGPREDNCDFTFWVNLRSMVIQRNRYAIYVGGGLLADSDIDAEWEETRRKAMTLLQQL